MEYSPLNVPKLTSTHVQVQRIRQRTSEPPYRCIDGTARAGSDGAEPGLMHSRHGHAHTPTGLAWVQLRVVISPLGLDHVHDVCWPKLDMWVDFSLFFPLLCFGPNVILCSFYSFGPFVVYFHISPAKQAKHQNLWNMLVESPIHKVWCGFH
jgi:hypothetical protein